jgi:hypothetical protein
VTRVTIPSCILNAQAHRKGRGKEAKLAYLGHVRLDNRHGLVANVCATAATGTAEREAALVTAQASVAPGSTVGGYKNFDATALVAALRGLTITPHAAQKTHSALTAGPPHGVLQHLERQGTLGEIRLPSGSFCTIPGL